MNNSNHPTSSVLETIKSNKITMKSRRYFMLRTIALILSSVVVYLVLLYISSLLILWLRQSGLIDIDIFSPRGFGIFLRTFPWIIAIISIIGIALLERLLIPHALTYRIPMIYSLLLIIGITIIFAGLIAISPFHRRAQSLADQNQLPPGIRELYQQDFEVDEVVTGKIIQIPSEGRLIIEARRREEFIVIILDDTKIKPGTSLGIGDSILVVGYPIEPGVIQAFGIQPFDPNFIRPPRTSPMMPMK